MFVQWTSVCWLQISICLMLYTLGVDVGLLHAKTAAIHSSFQREGSSDWRSSNGSSMLRSVQHSGINLDPGRIFWGNIQNVWLNSIKWRGSAVCFLLMGVYRVSVSVKIISIHIMHELLFVGITVNWKSQTGTQDKRKMYAPKLSYQILPIQIPNRSRTHRAPLAAESKLKAYLLWCDQLHD